MNTIQCTSTTMSFMPIFFFLNRLSTSRNISVNWRIESFYIFFLQVIEKMQIFIFFSFFIYLFIYLFILRKKKSFVWKILDDHRPVSFFILIWIPNIKNLNFNRKITLNVYIMWKKFLPDDLYIITRDIWGE